MLRNHGERIEDERIYDSQPPNKVNPISAPTTREPAPKKRTTVPSLASGH